MSRRFAPQEAILTTAIEHSARGPKRNGVFALWLVLRACGDLLPPTRLSTRGHRRRLENLRRRFSSLSLAAPLRRALLGALRQLEDGTPRAAAVALKQLVAPVQETLGPDARKVVEEGLREARAADEKDDTAQ